MIREGLQPIEGWDLFGVARCPEAQADGVPCTELGRDCAVCENAVRNLSPEQRQLLRERALRRRGMRST